MSQLNENITSSLVYKASSRASIQDHKLRLLSHSSWCKMQVIFRTRSSRSAFSPVGRNGVVVLFVFVPLKYTWERGRLARPLETFAGTQYSIFSYCKNLQEKGMTSLILREITLRRWRNGCVVFYRCSSSPRTESYPSWQTLVLYSLKLKSSQFFHWNASKMVSRK